LLARWLLRRLHVGYVVARFGCSIWTVVGPVIAHGSWLPTLLPVAGLYGWLRTLRLLFLLLYAVVYNVVGFGCWFYGGTFGCGCLRTLFGCYVYVTFTVGYVDSLRVPVTLPGCCYGFTFVRLLRLIYVVRLVYVTFIALRFVVTC